MCVRIACEVIETDVLERCFEVHVIIVLSVSDLEIVCIESEDLHIILLMEHASTY
jgi:hypothetical protein